MSSIASSISDGHLSDDDRPESTLAPEKALHDKCIRAKNAKNYDYFHRPSKEIPTSQPTFRFQEGGFSPSLIAEAAELGVGCDRAWQKVLESMDKHDEQVVVGWEKDMGNLLTFAGLFSAVVSVFTAVSYLSLLENSADTSARVLTQISLQLASFSVQPNFMNSTVPAAVLEPFTPDPVYVQVNTLWFLSLAIGLVTALFVIVVQQWLRVYQRADSASARNSVRLRQFRYNACLKWGVPEIVSVLPILLQIGLWLFLVGLLRLLWFVNHTVAVAVTAFVAVATGAFIISTILPIFSTTCPYRSSVTHTIIALSQTLYAYCVCIVRDMITGLSRGIGAVACTWDYYFHTRLVYKCAPLIQQLAVFRQHLSNGTYFRSIRFRPLAEAFWSDRDAARVEREAEALDTSALIWAEAVTPTTDPAVLYYCLGDLAPEEQPACVLNWLARGVKLSRQDYAFGKDALSFARSLNRDLDVQSRQWYRKILLEVLPAQWDRSLHARNTGADLLRALLYLAEADLDPGHAFKVRYTEALVGFCLAINFDEQPDKNERYRRRVLASSLFLISSNWKIEFDDDVTKSLCEWARGIHENIVPLVGDAAYPDEGLHEELLSANATALLAISRKPHADIHAQFQDEIVALVSGMDAYIADNIGVIKLLSSLSATGACTQPDGLPVTALASISCFRSLEAIARDSGLAGAHDTVLRFVGDIVRWFADNRILRPSWEIAHRIQELLGPAYIPDTLRTSADPEKSEG